MKNLSKHAQSRIQQRGIRYDALEIVLRYGSYQRVKGGTTCYMDKAAHQRARHSPQSGLYRKLSDQLSFFIIVSGDEQVVTVAHSSRRRLYSRRKPTYDRSKRQ